MKNKKAFTLADVLIALSIVGVLTAILIPAIQHARPDKEKIMFWKAYRVTSASVAAMIADAVNYPSVLKELSADGETVTRTDYTGHEFDNDNHPEGESWNMTRSKFAQLFIAGINSSEDPSFTSTTGTVTTSDGMSWTITQSTETYNGASHKCFTIDVDVNGTAAPNNISAAIPDRFQFTVHADGKIDITGASATIAKEYLLDRKKSNE